MNAILRVSRGELTAAQAAAQLGQSADEIRNLAAQIQGASDRRLSDYFSLSTVERRSITHQVYEDVRDSLAKDDVISRTVSDRQKAFVQKLGSRIAFGVVVIGLLGYATFTETIKQSAQRTANDTFMKLEGQMAKSAVTWMEKEEDRLLDRLGRIRKENRDELVTTYNKLLSRIEEKRESFDTAALLAKSAVAKETEESIARIKGQETKSASTVSEATSEALRKNREQAERESQNLERLAAKALNAVREAGQSEIDSLRSSVGDLRSEAEKLKLFGSELDSNSGGSLGASSGSAMLELKASVAIQKRDWSKAEEVIREAWKVNPRGFTDPVLMVTTMLLSDPRRIDELAWKNLSELSRGLQLDRNQVHYSIGIDIVVASIARGDDVTTRSVLGRLNASDFSQLGADGFLELIDSVAAKASPEDVKIKYAKVGKESLTDRGLSTLLEILLLSGMDQEEGIDVASEFNAIARFWELEANESAPGLDSGPWRGDVTYSLAVRDMTVLKRMSNWKLITPKIKRSIIDTGSSIGRLYGAQAGSLDNDPLELKTLLEWAANF